MMVPHEHDPRSDNTTADLSEEPHPTSPLVTSSLTSTMAEGADLMREQDAEILEQGISYTCSTGETPLLMAALIRGAPPGSIDIGISQVGGEENLHGSSRSLRDSHESSNAGLPADTLSESTPLHPGESFDGDTFHSTSANSSPIRTLSKMSSIGLDRANSSIASSIPRVVVRRCLSGEDRAAVQTLQTDTQESVEPSLSVNFEMKQLQPAVALYKEEELNAEDQPPGLLTWTKSKERLISEVAQFAEAVGEMPPTNENDVQEIIEESGSDDDDEEEDEDDDALKLIGNDTPPAIPALSPHKPERRRARSLSPVSSLSGSFHAKSILQGEGTDSNIIPDQTTESRKKWPFKPYAKGKKYSYLHKLPTDRVDAGSQDYKYKGICSNPPEITKRGITRGNYAQLHRKAWLEVSDKYHRYGKNLRAYYKHWETLGHPTNMFFDWLDSKGEAAGLPLPNLPECPRSVLDSDTVLYITNEDVQKQYEIEVTPDEQGRALMVDIDGDPIRTGSEGWIVVLRDHKLYGAEKVTSITGFGSKQRFHHSSFFGGKAVAAAGIMLTDETGHLSRFYPHSGHYRPGEAHMQRMLFDLHHRGVDLRTFDVDTQQILHVARKDGAPKGGPRDKNGSEKKKKIHSLHLKPAVYVACFLAHKARFMGEGVYSQIHKIRKASVATVTEALDAVDNGGYWKELRREFVE